MLETLLWVLGVITLARILWIVARSIYKYFLRPAVDLKKFRKDNAWAG